MSNTHDEAVRVETIAVLDAVEIGVVGFSEIFREVAAGAPLDPQRAENLAARCAELLKSITDTRNTLRLSAESHGVN
jgi:hypothetical protein